MPGQLDGHRRGARCGPGAAERRAHRREADDHLSSLVAPVIEQWRERVGDRKWLQRILNEFRSEPVSGDDVH
jgi:hypothetical protein